MLSKQPKRSQEAITSSGDFPPPSARTVSLNRLPVSSIAYKTGIRNIIIYIDAIGKWDKGNVDPASSNIETILTTTTLIFFFFFGEKHTFSLSKPASSKAENASADSTSAH
jgi:hypothetical protein